MKADPHLAKGLNVWNGKIAFKAVADDLGLPYQAWRS
jgi:alanine dehydrogenase